MELHLITKQMPDFISMAFSLCVLSFIVPGSALDHIYQIFFHLFVKLIVCLSAECTLNQPVVLFQFPRVRGRGWNRGNYPGNNSNGNPANMNPPVRPPEEEWDPEYTPKSRKYYLVRV